LNLHLFVGLPSPRTYIISRKPYFPSKLYLAFVATMNTLNELRINSVDYVNSLNSPIGVYLRREIFRKESKADATLKKVTYQKAVAEQSDDGSWDQLFVKTANNLWDLALLGYNAQDSSVQKGLEWLLSIQKHSYHGYPGFFCSSNRKDPSIMRSTLYGEFGPGCTIFYQTTYAIHLLHLFGLGQDKRVETTVKSYLQFWKPTWCGAWCTINVLRVLVEHALSKESTPVKNGFKHLAKLQTKTGAWKGLPFYHTCHALSRAEATLAKEQLRKALPSVVRRQNADGSWGREEKETATFLALDALRNMGNP